MLGYTPKKANKVSRARNSLRFATRLVLSLTTQLALQPNQATYKNNTTTLTRNNSITISLIKVAIAAIKSLGPREQFSYRQIVREYSYSRAALAQRYKSVLTLRAT